MGSRLSSLLSPLSPPLGRWSHPTSEAYARTCDQTLKAMHATTTGCTS